MPKHSLLVRVAMLVNAVPNSNFRFSNIFSLFESVHKTGLVLERDLIFQPKVGFYLFPFVTISQNPYTFVNQFHRPILTNCVCSCTTSK